MLWNLCHRNRWEVQSSTNVYTKTTILNYLQRIKSVCQWVYLVIHVCSSEGRKKISQLVDCSRLSIAAFITKISNSESLCFLAVFTVFQTNWVDGCRLLHASLTVTWATISLLPRESLSGYCYNSHVLCVFFKNKKRSWQFTYLSSVSFICSSRTIFYRQYQWSNISFLASFIPTKCIYSFTARTRVATEREWETDSLQMCSKQTLIINKLNYWSAWLECKLLKKVY